MVFISLVAFFALVAGVNAIMIRAAVSTFGGLETDSPYQAGLAFAREAASVSAQDALHWRVQAKASRVADGLLLVEVSATDADNRPLPKLQATARLVHPTDRRSDHVVELREGASGQFSGQTQSADGQWDLVIELTREGTRMFRSKNRVFIQ